MLQKSEMDPWNELYNDKNEMLQKSEMDPWNELYNDKNEMFTKIRNGSLKWVE